MWARCFFSSFFFSELRTCWKKFLSITHYTSEKWSAYIFCFHSKESNEPLSYNRTLNHAVSKISFARKEDFCSVHIHLWMLIVLDGSWERTEWHDKKKRRGPEDRTGLKDGSRTLQGLSPATLMCVLHCSAQLIHWCFQTLKPYNTSRIHIPLGSDCKQ